MILKGNLHNNAGFLGKYLVPEEGSALSNYLTSGKNGKERATVAELHGFVGASTLGEAMQDIELEAAMTQCEKPIFHAQCRLRKWERLTEAQWFEVANRTEKGLGLSGQPRAIVFHDNIKTGERHAHFVWSRIDRENHRAIDPGLYKRKLMEVQRGLERDLGLEATVKISRGRDRTSAPRRNEYEQSRRLNTDIKDIRENIRQCWDRSDSGRAFMNSLAEHGYTLAQGTRRDFVVIDQAGGLHVLGKRMLGVSMDDIRERLKDIDRLRLPAIEHVRSALDADRLVAQEQQQAYQAAKGQRTTIKHEGDWWKERSVDHLSEKQEATARADYKKWEAAYPRNAVGIEFEDYVQSVQDRYRERPELFLKPLTHSAKTYSRASKSSTRSMEGTTGKIAQGAARVAELIIQSMVSLLVAEPVMTRQQVKEQRQADGNVETLHARAHADAEQTKENAYGEADHVNKSNRQAKEVDLAQKTGINATAEAALNKDEYEHEREKQRGRSL